MESHKDIERSFAPIPNAQWLTSIHHDRMDIAYNYLLHVVERVKAGQGKSEIGVQFVGGVPVVVLHYYITREDILFDSMFSNMEEIWIALRMDVIDQGTA